MQPISHCRLINVELHNIGSRWMCLFMYMNTSCIYTSTGCVLTMVLSAKWQTDTSKKQAKTCFLFVRVNHFALSTIVRTQNQPDQQSVLLQAAECWTCCNRASNVFCPLYVRAFNTSAYMSMPLPVPSFTLWYVETFVSQSLLTLTQCACVYRTVHAALYTGISAVPEWSIKIIYHYYHSVQMSVFITL